MNFVSKFDGTLPFSGVHPKAQPHVESVQTKAPADAILVRDADLLFNGDFKRSGSDLVISRGDHELRLDDYFKGDKHVPLASPDGAYLTGKTIDALTGYVQMAQADGSAAAAKIIGHVTKLSGSATVIRNGVSIILNNGDNVHQGDVVQSGSNSTVGITFIDGSVFGLASNAKMVLNEMVYDPNGSGNSSFLSLVQGTISFVAGATAKHGDMKVDTPVATMGIRGTAVVVEIDFEVTVPGSAPPARFQVVVEPDGTSGAFVLLDRVTLAPMATVNQPGTVTTVSGAGTVSFLASAQLSPELMKLISEVFSQKFTDNSNPKSDTHFTDIGVPQNTFAFYTANGDLGVAVVQLAQAQQSAPPPPPATPGTGGHIPGPPGVVTFNQVLAERTALTGSSLVDAVSGHVSYSDINPGDVPTVSIAFDHIAYRNGAGNIVTSSLTTAQLSAIAAVSVPLTVVQDPAGKNIGTATWTYKVDDSALDFLAAGEKLTLTYMARVDNNFGPNNEFSFAAFTITITGTNDGPTIIGNQTTPAGTVTEDNHVDISGNVTVDGTVTFNDVDLTDTHTASFALKSSHASASLPGFAEGAGPGAANIGTFALTSVSEVPADGDTSGSVGWTFTLNDDSPVLQSLAEGQTITQVYTVTVSDGHGGTVTQEVTVTITGTNDKPTIDASATTASGGVTEDCHVSGGNIATSGTIGFDDIDLIDIHTASVAPATSTSSAQPPGGSSTYIGAFTLSAVSENPADTSTAGSVGWTFTLDDNDPTLQSLAEGQTLTQVYVVTLSDGHGGTATQEVTVTITGTNDTPTIDVGTTVASGEVTEDCHVSGGSIEASGTVGFDDIDLIDIHTASVTPASSTSSAQLPGFSDNSTYIGTFALSAVSENPADTSTAGSVGWTFTLDDNDPTLQSLAEGQSITQVYTVTVSDGHGGTATQEVTVTIQGTNDKPTIDAGTTVASGEVTEDCHVSGGNISTSGTVGFSDVDLIDVHTTSFTLLSSTSNAQLPGFVDNTTQIGNFTLDLIENLTDADPDGSVGWTFTLDNSDPLLQSLAANETITQVYRITISDGHGGTTYKDVTVTIRGTNDGPETGASTASGEVTEDAVVSGGNIATSGTVGFSDVDLIDLHTAEITEVSSSTNTTLPGFTANTTYIGNFTLDPVSEDNGDTDTAGSVGWKFTLDNSDPLLQSLTVDETITQVYRVTVPDGHGGTTYQDVTVTIHGTNDVPTVATALSDSANEGGDLVTRDLLAGATDVDHGETASLSVTDLTYLVDGNPSATPAGISLGSDGHTLTIDPSDPAFDYLAAGETTVITVSYKVTDVHGASVTQTETVTITGTNDVPTVAAALSDSANEGGDLVTRDLLAGATDVDHGETASLSVTDLTYLVDGNPSATPAGISLGSDGHTLTIDPSDPAFDYLAADETTVITVSYKVTDVHGASVTQTETITITGTNDVPTVATALSDSANEGGDLVTRDLLAGATDVDHGETASLSVTDLTYLVDGNPSATPAGISLGSDGHTLTIDPSDPAFDYLAADETTVITVSYKVTDVHGASVTQTETITITGTNDAPVITSDGGGTTASISIAENTTAVAAVQAGDVDHGSNLTYSILTGDDSPDAALFFIDPATGELSFINAPDYETPGSAAQSNVYTVKVQVSDGAGGYDVQTIQVTVTDEDESGGGYGADAGIGQMGLFGAPEQSVAQVLSDPLATGGRNTVAVNAAGVPEHSVANILGDPLVNIATVINAVGAPEHSLTQVLSDPLVTDGSNVAAVHAVADFLNYSHADLGQVLSDPLVRDGRNVAEVGLFGAPAHSVAQVLNDPLMVSGRNVVAANAIQASGGQVGLFGAPEHSVEQVLSDPLVTGGRNVIAAHAVADFLNEGGHDGLGQVLSEPLVRDGRNVAEVGLFGAPEHSVAQVLSDPLVTSGRNVIAAHAVADFLNEGGRDGLGQVLSDPLVTDGRNVAAVGLFGAPEHPAAQVLSDPLVTGGRNVIAAHAVADFLNEGGHDGLGQVLSEPLVRDGRNVAEVGLFGAPEHSVAQVLSDPLVTSGRNVIAAHAVADFLNEGGRDGLGQVLSDPLVTDGRNVAAVGLFGAPEHPAAQVLSDPLVTSGRNVIAAHAVADFLNEGGHDGLGQVLSDPLVRDGRNVAAVGLFGAPAHSVAQVLSDPLVTGGRNVAEVGLFGAPAHSVAQVLSDPLVTSGRNVAAAHAVADFLNYGHADFGQVLSDPLVRDGRNVAAVGLFGAPEHPAEQILSDPLVTGGRNVIAAHAVADFLNEGGHDGLGQVLSDPLVRDGSNVVEVGLFGAQEHPAEQILSDPLVASGRNVIVAHAVGDFLNYGNGDLGQILSDPLVTDGRNVAEVGLFGAPEHLAAQILSDPLVTGGSNGVVINAGDYVRPDGGQPGVAQILSDPLVTNGRNAVVDDVLTNSGHADQFLFAWNSSPDTAAITDFTHGENHIGAATFAELVDPNDMVDWLGMHETAITMPTSVSVPDMHARDMLASHHIVI